jgi:tRNA (guanine37-N1)-methyltransferase
MNISILTVFDALYDPFVHTSLVGRAQDKNIVHIDVQSFFAYVQSKKRIDAPTFGPGAGMLIRPEVVQSAVEDKEAQYGQAYKVFFSPRGRTIDQAVFQELADRLQQSQHIMFIPARYEGMDERVEQEYADMILSAGDFVVMGGDLPTMLVIEGMLRLIPDVIGKEESVQRDSFNGPFVDFPAYTEPVEWKGHSVPDVVRSGNHGAIEQWRTAQAVNATVRNHFSWLRSRKLTKEQIGQAAQYIPPHYVALLHSDVLVGEERSPGVTSVTSLDIHDIARSSKTYGIDEFFIVTPLVDQQKIVQKLLDFWTKGIGFDYNQCRYNAIQSVRLTSSLDQVIQHIIQKEGKDPLIIATSAQSVSTLPVLTYSDQGTVWAHDRPVLFLLGTGQGLALTALNKCDYVLEPLYGFSSFNHLSVRSAAAIIFDRWLGINRTTL